ncbi:MAG: proline dehydrogenase family protein [Halobacteriaceae archaeon]
MIPPIARRFVAGETPATALEHTREINGHGISGILNLLGEHYEERGPADADRDAYLDLIDEIGRNRVDACVSVKPSQIGLDAGQPVFEENYTDIVEYARDADVFVWMDMEDRTTVDATIDAFETATSMYPGGVGLCVQANLKRTEDDIERLVELPGKLRLVKGAYDEPPAAAYQSKSEVNRAYRERLTYLFEHADDGDVAVGSHDPAMIERAAELHEEFGTEYELQMLMGVREEAQRELADEVPVYQYIPYGEKWLSYFYRRVMERKENLLFAARAVLGR